MNPVEDWFCNQFLKSKNWIAYKFKSPSRRGVPDRLVIGPHGRHFFIEFKGEKESVRPEQKREINRLIDLGHCVYIVREKNEAINILAHHNSGICYQKAIEKTLLFTVDPYGKRKNSNRIISNK